MDLFLGTGVMQCSAQEVQEKQCQANHELQTLAEQQRLFIFICCVSIEFPLNSPELLLPLLIYQTLSHQECAQATAHQFSKQLIMKI